jgi:hypothetical protein
MFHFLFEFLEHIDETNQGYVERFLTHIEDFAFFNQLPQSFQEDLKNRSVDIEKLVSFIINNEGFGLANLPKGLIPFHRLGPFIMTPVQDHVVQGNLLNKNSVSVHFTMQPHFFELLKKQLAHLEGMTSKRFSVSISEQDPASNSIAFDEHFQPVLDEKGNVLTRPAGHGALFENFKAIDADLVFIKNIDNIQHFNRASTSIYAQQVLGGLYLTIQQAVQELLTNFSKSAFEEFNFNYQVFHPSVMALPESEIKRLLERPLRVCGMVRNEGQQGGGPFWVESQGEVSKQIVEKSQIRAEQIKVLIQSSHFNPVMMVCQGNSAAFNLDDYKDSSTYFKVEKSQKGKTVMFIEQPGLWNGSMAKWNSVFVEIPSETFSPVKSILDLLDTAHKAE